MKDREVEVLRMGLQDVEQQFERIFGGAKLAVCEENLHKPPSSCVRHFLYLRVKLFWFQLAKRTKHGQN